MPDLVKRVAVTLGVLACLFALDRVPIPGVDHETLAMWAGDLQGLFLTQQFSVGVVGVAPWLTATVLVEVACAFWAPWRPLRTGGPDGRARLDRAVRYVWLLLSVIQAFSIAVAFEQLRFYQQMIVYEPGLAFRAMTVVTLVGASALIGMLCRFAASQGLGAGFSLAVLLMFAMEPVWWWQWVSIDGGVPLVPVLIAAFGIVLVGARAPGKTLGLSVAGVVPLGVILQAATIAGLYSEASLVIGVVVLTAFLALIFQMPDLVARLHGVPQARVQRDLAVGIAANSVLMAALVWGTLDQGFPTFGYGLVLLPVILWDLVEEYQARGRGCDAPVWPVHRVYAVEPALEALRAEGIEAGVRGRRARALFHFFGPFFPIEILVPTARVDDARRVLQPLLVAPADG